jgi:hypothetical protein
MANSNPGLIARQVASPAQWNGFFTGKLDGDAGTASNLTLTGSVLLPTLQTSVSYASDVLAAAGGVAIGQMYRNGSALRIRQSYVAGLIDTITTSESWTGVVAGNFAAAWTTTAATASTLTGVGRGILARADTLATLESLTFAFSGVSSFSGDFSTDFGH